jgi:hypothetical protein
MPLNSPQIQTPNKLQHSYATHQDLMNLKDENTVNKLLNQTKFNEITTRLASIETDIKNMQTSLKKIEDFLFSNSDSNIESEPEKRVIRKQKKKPIEKKRKIVHRGDSIEFFSSYDSNKTKKSQSRVVKSGDVEKKSNSK